MKCLLAVEAKLARSAGASVQMMAREGDYATLRMPSGEMRMITLLQGNSWPGGKCGT